MKRNGVIAGKVRGLSRGATPAILDLFSGCGGISLGFHRAGCRVVAGIESDEHASATHAKNFHSEGALRVRAAQPRDITRTDPLEFLASLGLDGVHSVDVIVGGPPCTSFARVGRAKLREIMRHPEAFKRDPRGELYRSYLRFVEELAPVALFLENVPDMLNFGGRNLAEEIADALEPLGYRCQYTLLNAANYGVPQLRERLIFVGIHDLAGADYRFPVPTHWVNLPPGYKGTRQVALKALERQGKNRPTRYVTTPEAPADALPAVGARAAIGDLAILTSHLDGTLRRGARRFDQPLPYRTGRPSQYARTMREWPGFEADRYVMDHVIRSLSDRDYRIFAEMQPGDDYPVAHDIAVRLFEDELATQRWQTGKKFAPGTKMYEKLLSEYVPPYDRTKFPNKWWKLDPDRPVRTLMAHLGKDSYSHIHYDSEQARVISVREAARLQSFPDGFRFAGTMNPALRQIGNAVPPLLALAVARSMLRAIVDAAAGRRAA